MSMRGMQVDRKIKDPSDNSDEDTDIIEWTRLPRLRRQSSHEAFQIVRCMLRHRDNRESLRLLLNHSSYHMRRTSLKLQYIDAHLHGFNQQIVQL